MPGTLLHVPGQSWVACSGYRWCDDGAGVEVRVPAGDASAAQLQQRLRIAVGARALRVELLGDAEPLLDVAELHAEVAASDTAWRLDDDTAEIVLRLTKLDMLEPWPALAAGNAAAGTDGGAALAARAAVEALLRAASDGDEAALRAAAAQLDDAGDGVAAVLAATKDAHGRGALHFAALRGHASLCATLVAEPLCVPADTRDEDGDTPLALAARGGCADAGAALLAAGADANSRGAGDAQPLHHAAAAGSAALVAALLAAGADACAPSAAGPPLLWAAGAAAPECVQALLAAGASPDAQSAEGVGALVALAALGPDKGADAAVCVRALLAAGGDANLRAAVPDAFTALHVAADAGAADVAEALLAGGADADVQDAHGGTPLHVAAASGDVCMTQLLMRAAKRDDRVTPWEPAALIAAAAAGTFAPAGATSAPDAAAPSCGADAPPAPAPAPTEAPPATPEAAARASAAKAAGDAAFGRGDFAAAVAAYTAALADDSRNAALFSNRSVAALQAQQLPLAVADAEQALALRPGWAKACYRLGAALHASGRFEDAANAFFQGVQLGGGDDLARGFKKAVDAGRAEHQAQQAAQC